MPRLLLINPSNTHKGLGNLRATAFPPMNLPYLAACTPPHYQIEVLDENIEPFKYRAADVVGITAYTASVCRGYEIAQVYREKGVPTIMGGIHVSMMPEEALEFCDSVVVGEAEGVWPQVLADVETGALKRMYRGEWADLATLPGLIADQYEVLTDRTISEKPLTDNMAPVDTLRHEHPKHFETATSGE